MFKQVARKNKKNLLTALAITAAGLAFPHSASATIVEFQTSQGSITVNLFDETTPITVSNFLNYIDEGHYTNSVIHRAQPGFVVQGGGYIFDGEWPLTDLDSNAAISNEAIYSNIAGTIAMAKISEQPNSATDQWFFNLADNSTNLDRQNAGFTVFGQVIEGIEIVNNIAGLTLCSTQYLENIPMVMDAEQACADMGTPGQENFVILEEVIIIDSSEATASDLNPLISKYPDSDGDGVKDIDDAFPSDPNKSVEDTIEDNGGSVAWFTIAMLGLVTLRKRLFKH